MKTRTACILFIFCLPASSQAITYDFSTVDHPDSVLGRKLTAINNNGTLAGYYYSDYGHSFLFDGLNFTLFDYQATGFNRINGINDSLAIVLSHEIDGVVTHYTYENSTFTPFSIPEVDQTTLYAINNNGHLAVQTSVSTPFFAEISSFLYDGSFMDFSIEEAMRVYIKGVNNLNTAVGSYLDTNGNPHILTKNNDGYISSDIPGAITLEVESINDWGTIVGSYSDGTSLRGFVNTEQSQQIITCPESTYIYTQIFDINNSGQIVGSCANDAETHGFIASPHYMDSDRDGDSDGLDMAQLERDLSGGNADQSDLINFAQNFGSRQYFTHLHAGN